MSQPTDLADRYGAPTPARRAVLIGVVVVVVAALLGWLGWTIWARTTADVSSELIGFEVTDEHSVVARVAVDLADDDVVASCLLRASAEDHSVVGELRFQPIGTGHTEQTVRTERRATTVELIGCTTPGQPHPG